jgi:hypothetical protein
MTPDHYVPKHRQPNLTQRLTSRSRTVGGTRDESEKLMNILGLSISVEREASSRVKWTRRGVAMAVAAATVFSSGVAYAFWTATGTGSGSAQAKNFQALTINAGAAPGGQLYPGLTADGSTAGGDIVLSVSNPNPFPVTISSVTSGSGALTVTNATPVGPETQAQANTACATTSGVSIATRNNPGMTYASGSNIPPSASNFTVTISKVVSMSTASVTECQGATFTFAAAGVSLGLTSA